MKIRHVRFVIRYTDDLIEPQRIHVFTDCAAWIHNPSADWDRGRCYPTVGGLTNANTAKQRDYVIIHIKKGYKNVKEDLAQSCHSNGFR